VYIQKRKSTLHGNVIYNKSYEMTQHTGDLKDIINVKTYH